MHGTAEYYEYMKSLSGFETSFIEQSQNGVAVSYKKKVQ